MTTPTEPAIETNRWYTLAATVKDSYVSLTCRVYSSSAEQAKFEFTEFVIGARKWAGGPQDFDLLVEVLPDGT